MSAPKKSTRPRSRSDSEGMSPKVLEGSTRSIDGLNMAERAARDKKPTDNSTGSLDAAATTGPSGTTVAQERKAARALTAKQKKLDKNNDGEISGADFKKMKGGGRAKAKGYAMGGKVKAKGMAMGGKIKSKGMKAGGRAGSEKPDYSKAKKSGTLATHNSRGERIRSDEAATKRPMDFTGVASQSRGHKSKSDMFSDFGRHESGGGPTPTKNRTGRAGPKVVKKMAMGGKIKSKGMAMGGKIKSKGMAMGGKIKSKGMAMGGKVKAKGMARGGVATSKGAAMGGRGFGAARSSGKGARIF